MSEVDKLLLKELASLPEKPANHAPQSAKKGYSEMMSAAVARALAEALRRKGLHETLPLMNYRLSDLRAPTLKQNAGEEETTGRD